MEVIEQSLHGTLHSMIAAAYTRLGTVKFALAVRNWVNKICWWLSAPKVDPLLPVLTRGLLGGGGGAFERMQLAVSQGKSQFGETADLLIGSYFSIDRTPSEK